MLRRPRAGETEQDLLAFQESFISSGEQPAVSLAGGDGAGNKRKKRIESDRDIVELGGRAICIRPRVMIVYYCRYAPNDWGRSSNHQEVKVQAAS